MLTVDNRSWNGEQWNWWDRRFAVAIILLCLREREEKEEKELTLSHKPELTARELAEMCSRLIRDEYLGSGVSDTELRAQCELVQGVAHQLLVSYSQGREK